MTLQNIPMLASSMDVAHLDAVITNDQYVLEQKLDGHRILLRLQDGFSPLALTRGGNPYSKGLPKDLTDGLPSQGRWVLDGEWIAPHSGGDGIYWVFDILDANGLVDETTTLEERRIVLEAFMSLVTTPKIRLVPQAKTTAEKQALVDRCRAEGSEGVMAKIVSGTYVPGHRSRTIFKAKFVETADVVVLALRDDLKDSVRLGAYDENGNMVDVGRASLIGKEKRGAFQVNDVLEVRYLYMGAGNRLFQPTILKRRDDKIAQECKTNQFKHVSKKVLA